MCINRDKEAQKRTKQKQIQRHYGTIGDFMAYNFTLISKVAIF